MEKDGKFIQKAIKHKGSLHKKLEVPLGEKIPKEKIEKASTAKGSLGKEARLAKTLLKLRRRRK